eukprot:scaffold207_cov267-Pinguiococcus_pyrenoidosus.AAC.15
MVENEITRDQRGSSCRRMHVTFLNHSMHAPQGFNGLRSDASVRTTLSPRGALPIFVNSANGEEAARSTDSLRLRLDAVEPHSEPAFSATSSSRAERPLSSL